MSITADLNHLLEGMELDFIERAIAREIHSMLTSTSTTQVGLILIDSQRWSAEWQVPDSLIWGVIQALEARGYWCIVSSIDGEVLSCQRLADSAKVISRKNKRANLAAVQEKAASQRAKVVSLGEINLQSKAFAEITSLISQDDRLKALKKGYQGWLPTERYAAIGLTYKPDSGLLSRCGREYPHIDLTMALGMMFEDLREHPNQRPALQRCPQWIIAWLQKNEKRLIAVSMPQVRVEPKTHSLDDY